MTNKVNEVNEEVEKYFYICQSIPRSRQCFVKMSVNKNFTIESDNTVNDLLDELGVEWDRQDPDESKYTITELPSKVVEVGNEVDIPTYDCSVRRGFIYPTKYITEDPKPF